MKGKNYHPERIEAPVLESAYHTYNLDEEILQEIHKLIFL